MQKLLRGLQSNESGQCVVENIFFHVLSTGHPGVGFHVCVFACMYARSEM